MSLISGDDTFALASVLVGVAAFGFWAETTAIGRKLSGALIILVSGVVLANVGLIPNSAPLYGTVSSLLVPVAIPMLLFRADLKQVLLEIGPMLKAFVASVIVISASIAFFMLLFDFGPHEAEVGGALAASYIGGSLNFVATAQAVELTDQTHYVAALTADTIGAILFLVLLMALPAIAIARRAMPSRYIAPDGSPLGEDPVHHSDSVDPPFDIVGLSAAVAASLLVCALGWWISDTFDIRNLFVLVITVLALAVANFARRIVAAFNSEFEVGTFFLYIFFAAIGAGADLGSIAGAALPYVILICAAVVLFIILIIVVGRLLRLDLAELMVAANACILGPPTAAAMAAGLGWRDLVTPGMLAGILGYSVGTFIGVGIAQLFA